MKMIPTMEFSSGGLYFASSGEKIVEVNEVVFTEEDISCKSKAEKEIGYLDATFPRVMTSMLLRSNPAQMIFSEDEKDTIKRGESCWGILTPSSGFLKRDGAAGNEG